MKKLILLLAIIYTVSAKAQEPVQLDTVIAPPLSSIVITTLTLKSRDWSYLVGSANFFQRDSAVYSELRNVRTQLLAANPQGWNANVSVNNIAGWVVVRFYEHIRTMPAGEYEQLDPTTKPNILSKTNLKTWFDQIDANFKSLYNYKRDTGKYIILDQ